MIPIYYFQELTSTMEEARSFVEKGTGEAAVIVAAHQTKGRGRRGRSWEFLQGNLFMTCIYYNNCPLAIAPQLSFVACVAVAEFLRPFLPPGNSITYKWPNDLLLNGKKVSGILLETIELPGDEMNAYLIGCGLNIANFPKNVRYPTTSLQEEGVHLTYEEILQGTISSIQRHLGLWANKGFNPIYEMWMKWAAHLDAPIKVDLQGKIQEGICKGLDKEGSLLLKTPNSIITINAGEVIAEVNHAFSD